MNSKKQTTLSFGGKRSPLKTTSILPESAAKPKKTKKSISSNYIMDLGQKDLCTKTCPDCGMTYMFKLDEDTKLHAKFCASQKYIDFRGWKNEKVVTRVDSGRIIEIGTNEPKSHQKKIDEIISMIDQSLGTPELKGDYKTYIYVNDNKVYAALICERIETAHQSLDNEILHKEHKATLGISRIWVHPAHRRQSLATRLFNSARYNFIYGFTIPLEEIAFSQPTDDGKHFATSKNPNYLVYRHISNSK